jgi:cysteine desulfurase
VAFETNGDPEIGLAGLVSLSFAGLEGPSLAADLSLQGHAVGVGSACSADRPEPSRAILALGRSPEAALGTIRVSLGRTNDESSVLSLAAAIVNTVRRLSKEA